MENSVECEYLAWDSEFFGRTIARAMVSRLTEDMADKIESWCAAQNIECLYFLADSSDPETTKVAQARGFRFVDARLTLERRTNETDGKGSPAVTVRSAEEEDIPALRMLARTAHHDSRFYFDGNFLRMRCDALFEAWIEKSCRGWAQKVFVAGENGQADGYLTCHVSDAGEGQIALVGVSENARGKGLGTSLIWEALRWFEQQGIGTITVVTQGRNVAAQRLYQKCGFATRSMEFWFHKWFSAKGASE